MSGIEEFQPTRLSKWIAATTATLAPSAPFLHEGLQKLGWTVAVLAEPQVRLLLGLSVLSMGMVLLNLALLAHIRHLKQLQIPAASPPPPAATATAPEPARATVVPVIPKRLDDTDIEILKLLAGVKFSPTSELTKSLGKKRALVEFHLVDLEKGRHIYSTHGSADSMWYIDQAGRRALVERGLL